MAKGIPLMGRGPNGRAKMINVDENGNVKVQLSGPITEMRDVWQATITAGSTGWLLPVVKALVPPFVIIVKTQQLMPHVWTVSWRRRGLTDGSAVPRLYWDGTPRVFSVDTTEENEYSTALFVDVLGASHFNLEFKNNKEFDVDISVDIVKW